MDELDYLQAMTTSAPIFVQLHEAFPEVVAVNALYTHGLVVIVSTQVRYGGFAKAVGLRVLSTTHGLGYAKVVIVVDADVDPFDLKQVMWAISVKVNPSGDIVTIPNLPENLLDPAGVPNGISSKMIIDATTPVAPDRRGDYGEELDTPEGTDAWHKKLADLIKETWQMNTPTETTTPSMCPRCRSGTVAHLASSPLEGVWSVFQCTTCLLYMAVERTG